ncbi:MAG: WXG100 family type VII secretion target [Corynebacterium sp.]|uniref:WXG100 family type VII secretion target n=1 Tax=Corynebacterium sp. TaxID=1720 RepID=UPI0026DB8252|nr:WXG100 family type VII secretion target [Corynebacterium sp.]MDO5030076.1 WXG100 family type VII secretion target [Corynebacterium sp.]
MEPIHYGFGGINGAASDIRSTSGSINNLLGDLKKRIAPMVATWEGDSSESYQNAQRQWDSAAEELNVILNTIADTVSAGSDRMADINRRAAASWG